MIGNSHYKGIDKLANPERDATLLYDAFRRLGFEQVQLVIDGSRAATVLALKSFAEAAANADWAVVYYAGHGIEFDGSNYLVPVDVKYDQDADIPKESVALDQVLNAVAGAAKFRLVILDACRENPFVPEMTKSDNSTIGRRSCTHRAGVGNACRLRYQTRSNGNRWRWPRRSICTCVSSADGNAGP